MNTRLIIPLVSLLLLTISNALVAQEINTEWLDAHITKSSPRLLWRAGDEDLVRSRLASDPAARVFYDFILQQADGILALPPLTRTLEGKRLLVVSRNALKRTSCLSFAWRMTRDKRYINRLEELLVHVSSFEDWNPSHFLDVAEMSLAVALALDWTGNSLSPQVRQAARAALLKHGLQEAESPEFQGVFSSHNNWNQVCNTGIVAAALVLADEEPEMAVRAINRMITNLPLSLDAYAPDGVYPEGTMYWSYGTEFTVILNDILETAIGTNFDLIDSPGFMESVDFVHLLQGPSKLYYNFSDSTLTSESMRTLLWFALKTGEARHHQRTDILNLKNWNLDPASLSGRLLPVELLWFIRFEERNSSPLPLNWFGRGDNPIGVFRSSFTDPHALYLAFKGGRANNNHGNMDAGSFIFELDGIRWGIDPGTQPYPNLEKYFQLHGGNLWSNDQDSARWSLLSKNNSGHSTITIDQELHQSSGFSEILGFDTVNRSAIINLTNSLGHKTRSSLRKFRVLNNRSILIDDDIELRNGAKEVRWQLMTQAEVTTTPNGALLKQGNKSLLLEVLSPEGIQVSITSLNTPPLPVDIRIPNLKRVDLVIPSHFSSNNMIKISVKMTGGSPDLK